MGAMMIERIHGLLGVPDQLSPRAIAHAAGDARVIDRAHAANGWDPDAFCAGAEAMLGAGRDPDAIGRFLAGDDQVFGAADLPLLGLLFGNRARMELPLKFFAGSPSQKG